jgi:hypothetical protein
VPAPGQAGPGRDDAGKHAESVAKAEEAAKAINLTLKKK